jgi:hypothetical protein
MAVFAFQIGDDGLLVHDFIQEDNWFFTDYIEAVKERGYRGKCYVPHDISVNSKVAVPEYKRPSAPE